MFRVLVVDAEGPGAELLASSLPGAWSVELARSERELGECLGLAHYDLVVVRDRPGLLSASRVATRCRVDAQVEEVLVIFGTGQGPGAAEPMPGLDCGFFFLTEPYSRAQLVQAAERTIRLGSRVRALLSAGLGLAPGPVRVGPWTEPPAGGRPLIH